MSSLGTIWINDYHPYVLQAEWGGMKRSGNGRELGLTGLDGYREIKHIWQNTNPRPERWFRGITAPALRPNDRSHKEVTK